MNAHRSRESSRQPRGGDQHIGVPMMLAERYRDVPAIRALFAERGVTLIDEEPS